MFDAEKLLGKVLQEVMGSSHSHKKKKSSLLQGLTSGAGLMTAIGLGIGAYEILKEKKTPPTPGPAYGSPPPPPPPPSSAPNWGNPAPSHPATPPPAPMPASAPPPTAEASSAAQDLALRLIQVMIAAAHADGTLDEEEEKAILTRLKTVGLTSEERLFLLDELHQPKSIDELTAGISDPTIAKTLYMVAVTAIAIDSPGERAWLDRLAAALPLSKAVQQFIEEER